jgi:hypothetical protein
MLVADNICTLVLHRVGLYHDNEDKCELSQDF